MDGYVDETGSNLPTDSVVSTPPPVFETGEFQDLVKTATRLCKTIHEEEDKLGEPRTRIQQLKQNLHSVKERIIPYISGERMKSFRTNDAVFTLVTKNQREVKKSVSDILTLIERHKHQYSGDKDTRQALNDLSLKVEQWQTEHESNSPTLTIRLAKQT